MDERSGAANGGGAILELPATLPELLNGAEIGVRLRNAGVPLTLQRVAIAHVVLADPVHITADEVLSRVRAIMPEISRATVYNTLKLFKDRGLVREVIVNADQIVFDSTTAPHHHFYDVDTGMVTDVPAGAIAVVGTPSVPPDLEIESIELVVRVRRRKT